MVGKGEAPLLQATPGRLIRLAA